MKASALIVFAFTLGLAAANAAWSRPVVYTARTVASGRLGSVDFTDARITISFRGDTRNVQTAMVNGAVLYTNAQGFATLSITQPNGRTIRATFRNGEIYARYDTQLGLVGFASAIGPAYPLIVGCFDPFVCSDIGSTDGFTFFSHYDGIATQLADIAAHPGESSTVTNETLNLPTNLSQSTLLTGYAHACSVALDQSVAPNFTASCPAAPSQPLHTDRGDFFLVDMDGADGASTYRGIDGIFTATVGETDQETDLSE